MKSPSRKTVIPVRYPLNVPVIQDHDMTYVMDCLRTGWVSSVGAYVSRFENQFAKRVHSPHAVATVNGTSALHLALRVSGIQPDDEVLVSTLTFIAPANAIRYLGAWPVFIDADPVYWQMDPGLVESFLRDQCRFSNGAVINKKTGRRVKVILPVHVLGHPCPMNPLMRLAKHYKLSVIEDASESLGALYEGKPVGTIGRIGCFSFNGNKTITTGGGGMLVTSDAKTAHLARHLTTQAKDEGIEYIHRQVGYNYRLTNLQAALGCGQLEHLNQYLHKKRKIAEMYEIGLSATPGIRIMQEASWARSSFWMYTVAIDRKHFGLSSRELHAELRAKGIETRPLWQPIHLSPAHRGSMAVGGSVAERLWEEALSLPSTVNLTESGQQFVLRAIRSLARKS